MIPAETALHVSTFGEVAHLLCEGEYTRGTIDLIIALLAASAYSIASGDISLDGLLMAAEVGFVSASFLNGLGDREQPNLFLRFPGVTGLLAGFGVGLMLDVGIDSMPSKVQSFINARDSGYFLGGDGMQYYADAAQKAAELLPKP